MSNPDILQKLTNYMYTEPNYTENIFESVKNSTFMYGKKTENVGLM